MHNHVHYKIVIVKSCDKENVHQLGTMSPTIMWNTGQQLKRVRRFVRINMEGCLQYAEY